MEMKELKFDEKGLIPAVVQDHYTKEVLTLAYMNAESLAITIDERRTCLACACPERTKRSITASAIS